MAARHPKALDAMIQDLLSLTPDRVQRKIATPEYRRLDLARGLLNHSASIQSAQPEQSCLAALAASTILKHLPNDEATHALLQRGLFIAGNGARLLGNLAAAASTFDSTFAYFRPLSADLLRGIAVLRWEQARYDEAAGLLTRAERLLRSEGTEAEVAATRRLLVLVHADLGEDAEALRLFTALGPSDAESRPWLGARTALTAAFLLAGQKGAAPRESARAALAQGRALLHLVASPKERLHIEWLAARAAARLDGEPAAGGSLTSLRDPFLAELPWIDSFLLNLDLMACRFTSGQDVDLQSLEVELRRHSLTAEERDLTYSILGSTSYFFPELTPWESASVANRQARRQFRLFRLPAVPIPFLLA
jgi:tetratricopeptide (TPR) repeat protein